MDDWYAEGTAPPRRPLWEGIYEFPWRLVHLRAFVAMAMAFAFLSLFAWGFVVLIRDAVLAVPEEVELSGPAMILYRGASHVFAGLCLLSLLASLYPVTYFLRVVEDTGSGGDDVDFADIPWYECLGRLLFFVWILGWSTAAAFMIVGGVSLVFALTKGLVAVGVAGVGLGIFPILLLSTMSGGSAWILIDPALVSRLFVTPTAALILYLNTAVLFVPAALLAYWVVMDMQLWLAPLVGLDWATVWLVYGRVVGRVGWVVMQDEKHSLKRRRRKPRLADDAG